MIPVISIVGKSDSGKTTLIEKIIPELLKRGYAVGTIKHDVHGFDIDREGKDSWRHRKAGSRCTVISSPSQLALVRDMDHDATLSEIQNRFIDKVDLILTEGYKRESAPKIEIFRQSVHSEPLCSPEDKLVAIVSDTRLDLGVPCLGLEEIGPLADIIENTFLKKRSVPRITLTVNGKHVSLKPFIAKLIEQSIKGTIDSLKGCENPEDIDISIR